MKNVSSVWLWTVIAVLVGVFSWNSVFANPNVEVVESVPIETNLAVPGVRSTQDVWLEMINSARQSIDLEQFYIDNQAGQSLEPILNALITAATVRNVQIRFLVDAKFFGTYSDEPKSLSQVQNISVKTIDFSRMSGIQHSKYFVVDHAQGFVGSANFDWLALTHIHEIGLKVNDGTIAAGLESIFEKDWKAASDVVVAASNAKGWDALGLFKRMVVQIKKQFASIAGLELLASPGTFNPAGIPDTLSQIVAQLDGARSSVKIQMYQYTTNPVSGTVHFRDLDNAIRRAAAQGARVQLLVDVASLKTGSVDLKALAAVPNIMVRTVTIPQWSGGAIPYARLIHSKYFIVDHSSSWVGSENWSEGYFTGCRNVGLSVQLPDVSAQLERIFDQVWSSPYTAQL